MVPVWFTLEPGIKPWSTFLIMLVFSMNVASMDNEYFVADRQFRYASWLYSFPQIEGRR